MWQIPARTWLGRAKLGVPDGGNPAGRRRWITNFLASAIGSNRAANKGERTSSLSAGTNALLRLGATPVTCAADVLESYGIDMSKAATASLGPVADTLLERLGEQALTADELVRVSGLEPSQSAAVLMELELAGRVTIEDGVYRVAI